jgi:ADP-L-glycero-D-manno-heptose 6-epimerase
VAFVPFPEQLRGRYQASTKSDPTRLRSTGYRHAFLTLEQGMTSYYDVLLEQARRSETGGLG